MYYSLGGDDQKKTKTFNDLVDDLAEEISADEINKYATLHLDPKELLPKHYLLN